MTRHVPSLDANLAEGERVAVAKQLRALLGIDSVLPIGVALGGQQQPRASLPHEIARAGEKVRVNVRLGDVRDAQLLGGGRGKIRLEIAQRVDHERLAGRFGADHVTGLRQTIVVEALQKHERIIDYRRWTGGAQRADA